MNILVVFTYGYSLKTWVESGTLERELSIYRELQNKFDHKFTFLTYGDISDNEINIMNLDVDIRCGPFKFNTDIYKETMPNGKSYYIAYNSERKIENSDKYVVPDNHYFLIGDNRDCSKDSRFLSEVGYVHKNNLVGKAQILFFSSDPFVGSIVKFWKWNEILRLNRFFKIIE